MNTSPDFRRGLSRIAARVTGSRFAKPIARVALVAASVVILAFIGYAASPHSLAGSASAATPSSTPVEIAAPTPSLAVSVAPAVQFTIARAEAPPASQGAATPDDPVILNSATAEDFRRLPGIGEKRANAIVLLRTRQGRFRAVEDLLKVKGIGRATLKRLRPLVRLDSPALLSDAGAGPSPIPPK